MNLDADQEFTVISEKPPSRERSNQASFALARKSGVSLPTTDHGHFPDAGGYPGARLASVSGTRGRSGSISPRKSSPPGRVAQRGPSLQPFWRPSGAIHRYVDGAMRGTHWGVPRTAPFLNHYQLSI